MEEVKHSKRKRGRPFGAKDSKPRYRAPLPSVATEPSLTVEQKLRKLARPMTIKELAAVTGMSKAHLRKNIVNGKLQAFKSGVILIEAADALAFWRNGQSAFVSINPKPAPALYNRRAAEEWSHRARAPKIVYEKKKSGLR